MKFGYERSIEAMRRRTERERGAEDGGETCEERQTWQQRANLRTLRIIATGVPGWVNNI